MRPPRSGNPRGLRSGGSPLPKSTPPPGRSRSSSLSSRSKRRGRALPLTKKREEVSDKDEDINESPNSRSKDDAFDKSEISRKSDGSEDVEQTPVKAEEYKKENANAAQLEYLKTIHAMKNGKMVKMTVTVAGITIKNDLDIHAARPVMGQDGNQFYCAICNGFGEVICCDGCPKVYHTKCIPTGDPARVALDNDEDPWFCPECREKGVESKTTKPSRQNTSNEEATGGAERRTTKRKCSDRRHCENCGAAMHHPGASDEDSTASRICSSCREEHTEMEEQEDTPEHDSHDDEMSNSQENSNASKVGRRLRSHSIENEPHEDDDLSEDDASELANAVNGDNDDVDGKDEDLIEEEKALKTPERKRRKRANSEATSSSLKKEKRKRKQISDSKKKKKKRREKHFGKIVEESGLHNKDADNFSSRSRLAQRGLVQCTPAFFFFITDYKMKIERALARKHRYFNRLTKGMERNELIAREGAQWWVKLRPTERRRYFAMSMRDFEEKVIEWKEEKTLREMVAARDPDDRYIDDSMLNFDDEGNDLTPEDEGMKFQRHQRLYLSTSVGSKPFTPEIGKSNNRILLELLQDMRFHPMPLFNPKRIDKDSGTIDRSKISIPFFDVQGPVATCAGDECSGCTRGWNHFCPVLKRRIPAIENRARLQPPMSSLMATRVGLGLKTKIPDLEDEADGKDVDLFDRRLTTDAQEAKRVPPIPSFTLTNPMSRADDVVCFVEECLAMKVPEPPRPAAPTMSDPKKKKKNSALSRGALPLRRKSPESLETSLLPEYSDESKSLLNKCGRCRTIIENDTGCIQCRRAQLVINTSKRTTQGEKKGDVKVQTTMIGRLTVKENNFENQDESDRAVANSIVKVRWMPCAVLPPEKTYVPIHDPKTESGVSGHGGGDELRGEAEEDSNRDEGDSNKESEDETSLDLPNENETTNDSMLPHAQTKNEDELDTHIRSSRRRIRSNRAVSSAIQPEDMETHMTPDRQELAQRHREEARELSKTCLNVTCCAILLAMVRRDPLCLFAEPVPANVVGYSTVVTSPIDFGKIKSRVQREKYTSLSAFISDARLLCTNALAFNPPGSIYSKTAKELHDVLDVMQKRAVEWINAIKDAHASSFARRDTGQDAVLDDDDPYRELRKTWPEAVDMLENCDWLQDQVSSDFTRTKENEAALYGSIAVRRAAAAAESSLSPYTDSVGIHNAVIRRSHIEDENLRRLINTKVAQLTAPIQLKDIPRWREEAIIRTLRRVQSRRVEGRIMSDSGCARCDGIRAESKMALTAVRWGRNKRKGELDTLPRVAESRLSLSTGLGSRKVQDQIGGQIDGIELAVKIEKREEEEMEDDETKSHDEDDDIDEKIEEALQVEDVDAEVEAGEDKNKLTADAEDSKWDRVNEVAVTVQGSGIHGWGLFADQPFKKGDVVAEYVGEYISNAVADAREKMYQERRIQDYQFRVDENLVIDATLKGGHGRYINHNCNPNCIAKIIDEKKSTDNGEKNLKRVMIIAQRDIKAREEITYDYQFPLELDLDSRIPCNCGSLLCRGFMNWDLPEKGSKNRILRTQKRGGNMRDRIRRLGRPLKKQDL